MNADEMTDDFVKAYRLFGDIGEGMEKIESEMKQADTLLYVEHPEYFNKIHDVLVMSSCLIR